MQRSPWKRAIFFVIVKEPAAALNKGDDARCLNGFTESKHRSGSCSSSKGRYLRELNFIQDGVPNLDSPTQASLSFRPAAVQNGRTGMSMVGGTSGGLIAHAIQLMELWLPLMLLSFLIFGVKYNSLMCCRVYYKRLYARLSADARVNGFPSELSSR